MIKVKYIQIFVAMFVLALICGLAVIVVAEDTNTYKVDLRIVANGTWVSPIRGTRQDPSGITTFSSDEEAVYEVTSMYEDCPDIAINGRRILGIKDIHHRRTTYTFPKGTRGDYVVTGAGPIRHDIDDDYHVNLNGFTWQPRKDSLAIGAAFKTADSAPEFRIQTYNLQTNQWQIISDWSSSNWVDWKGTVGDYWLHCEMRSADKLATTSKTMAFRYTAGDSKINGTYSGWRNGEVLLGATTVNQNTKIQFKIYNLDTKQWFYLTDENNRSNWVSWKAKKGNYWVHFESRTDDGRLADTTTYCFAVK